MNDKTGNDFAEKFHILDTQEITLKDFPASGLTLDIGGGGEGVIGKLMGDQVIAIDPYRGELEDAADGPLKIVMNANNLKFLDDVFDVVTSFFTLMYVEQTEHKQVFQEAYRVLAPGGRFLIWDLIIPQQTDQEKDVVVIMLKIIHTDWEIDTGYGTKWPSKSLDITHYISLGNDVGFSVGEQSKKGNTFFMELIKKPNSDI